MSDLLPVIKPIDEEKKMVRDFLSTHPLSIVEILRIFKEADKDYWGFVIIFRDNIYSFAPGCIYLNGCCGIKQDPYYSSIEEAKEEYGRWLERYLRWDRATHELDLSFLSQPPLQLRLFGEDSE